MKNLRTVLLLLTVIVGMSALLVSGTSKLTGIEVVRLDLQCSGDISASMMSPAEEALCECKRSYAGDFRFDERVEECVKLY